MNQTYVALDIETTGLDAETEEIIEIGAVKYHDSDVSDIFQTLVNPRRAVSYRIRLMCGIEQSELNIAPPFPEVADRLRSFIRGCVVVGHGVSFDLGFLSRKGIVPPGPVYDTCELATILLFQQPDYSLASLAKGLGLSSPRHRALPDALATKELFLALVDRALQLDIATLSELVRLAENADWQAVHFFRMVLGQKAKTAFSTGRETIPKPPRDGTALWPLGDEPPLTPRPDRTAVDIGKLTHILERDGILAQALHGYEHRPGQIRMMQAVAQALNNSEHLIVEAGTGTGKSIAYLLPSIFFALENCAPVVISTNTINLQEQLVGKDIPDLLRALGRWREPPVENLRVVQLKGRSNYLCPKKYEALRANEGLSVDEARLLARITVWLLSTHTGDRAELNLSSNESPMWNRLCAQSIDRTERQCPHYQRATCFLYRARRAAEKAHVVVVNHALLLSDLAAEAKILPPHRHLIIDEGHHLEDEATNQLGAQVTQRDLLGHLGRLKQQAEGARRTSLLAWLADCFRGSAVPQSRQRQIRQFSESLSNHVEKAQSHVLYFLDRLRDFVQAYSDEKGDYDRDLLLTPDKRAQPGWSRIEIAWEELSSALKDIADDLDRLYLAFEDLSKSRVAGYEYLVLELSTMFSQSNDLRQQLSALVSSPDPDSVYWLTVEGRTNAVGLYSAPLSVARPLRDLLFSTKDCVVLTGATLSTEGTFEYFKGRLGLECVNELLLGTPFDYLKSALVYLPQDIPDPGSAAYQRALEKTLVEVCSASRGRTLVLFTSHAALKATQSAVQSPLEQEGILVLAQGVDGTPKQLLASFKAHPQTVLLGTASLWEGIDVVGDALSVLVIAKLPFNVPTEPVFAARSQLLDDPFNEYAVPQAAIRFRQGFGRLIRSKNDRGAVIIFDKRIQTKRYGSAFLDSIPMCTVVRGPSRELPRAVAQWLDRAQNGQSERGEASSRTCL